MELSHEFFLKRNKNIFPECPGISGKYSSTNAEGWYALPKYAINRVDTILKRKLVKGKYMVWV